MFAILLSERNSVITMELFMHENLFVFCKIWSYKTILQSNFDCCKIYQYFIILGLPGAQMS